jgi:Raf kinase inhibitor-like YbhB/YbcL family protein
MAQKFINPSNPRKAMELSSPAFANGGKIPLKNISIPLAWKGAPPGTKSFALSIVDIHPVAREWVHWLVINIPPTASSIPEGSSGKSMPKGCFEMANSYGGLGYGGPQPPRGTGDHPYVVTLYALNIEKLPLVFNTSLTDFKKSITNRKVLASASMTGIFSR